MNKVNVEIEFVTEASPDEVSEAFVDFLKSSLIGTCQMTISADRYANQAENTKRQALALLDEAEQFNQDMDSIEDWLRNRL